jgi:hypothetical protein
MKVTSAALAALSLVHRKGCHASPLLRADTENEDRKLQSSNHVTISSPLNFDGYFRDILFPEYTSAGNVCYNQILETVSGGPTTAQLLVMFSDQFVEHKGKVYAAPEEGYSEHVATRGLYEVIDQIETCVKFELLYADDDIGQIVASSQFDPIQIIGISGTTIYGYYPDSSNGVWLRKRTGWGDAQDGSLVVGPVLNGEVAYIAGLSANNRLFNLWGSYDNFNYARHDDIGCVGDWGSAGRPAIIDDWAGFWAGERGIYCRKAGSNQLMKWTWHESGSITTELIWEPAARIGRLAPSSNIYGVSTNGNLLVLWDQQDVAVHSVPLELPELTQVHSVGGVDNAYAMGIFASNHEDRVFNVYWEDVWKTKEMPINFERSGNTLVLFGNHDDKTYVLYGSDPMSCAAPGYFFLKRFDFVGGADRHEVVGIQSGTLSPRRFRQLKHRKLCR